MDFSDPLVKKLFTEQFGIDLMITSKTDCLQYLEDYLYAENFDLGYRSFCHCCGASLERTDEYKGIALLSKPVPFTEFKRDTYCDVSWRFNPSKQKEIDLRYNNMQTTQHFIPDLNGPGMYLTVSQEPM